MRPFINEFSKPYCADQIKTSTFPKFFKMRELGKTPYNSGVRFDSHISHPFPKQLQLNVLVDI